MKSTFVMFLLLCVTLLGCTILYFTTQDTINKSLWSALALVAALALQGLATSQQKSL